MMSMAAEFPSPEKYDKNAIVTVPRYSEFHNEAVNVVKNFGIKPKIWLDTGCGTAKLVHDHIDEFPDTEFVLSDPTRGMIDIAKDRMSGNKRCSYVIKATDELMFGGESVDVITAILCHHYYHEDGRRKAEENCFRMLKKGGIYVTVEHTAPVTEEGFMITRARWKEMLVKTGRTEEEAEDHLARYNVSFFPITMEAHIRQLKDCGFTIVEPFIMSYFQVGFYAIK